MSRNYLSIIGVIICMFLSGCGVQDDPVKDSGTVLQSDEEVQSPDEVMEDMNGQENGDTLPPFFVDIEDEYPKGVRINDQTFDVNLNPFGKVTY